MQINKCANVEVPHGLFDMSNMTNLDYMCMITFHVLLNYTNCLHIFTTNSYIHVLHIYVLYTCILAEVLLVILGCLS